MVQASSLLGQKVVKIEIKGNQRTETQAIRVLLRLKVGQTLNRSILRQDVQRIFGFGRFSDVTVQGEAVKGGVAITFLVKEKPSIREIRFVGNKELGETDVKGVVDLKKFGILDLAKVKKNVEKIKNLYIEKGFYLAEVRSEISKPVKASVIVTFRISENAKIRIRQINFVGNKRVPSSVLRQYVQTSEHDLLSLLTGRSTYQEALITRDQMLLQAYYFNNGYVRVKLGKPKVYLDRTKKAMYITYFITEGKQYRYKVLDFAGDLLWSSTRMKRMLTIRSGQLFNREKLYKQNILRLKTRYEDRGYAYANVIPRTKINDKKQTLDMTFYIQKGPRVRIERIELSGNSSTQDKVVRREIRVNEGDYYNGSRIILSQRRIFALGFFEKNHPLYGIKVLKKRGSAANRIILTFILKEKSTGTFQIGAGLSTFESIIFNAQIAKNNLFGRGQSISLSAQISGIRSNFQLRFTEPHLFDSNVMFDMSVFNFQRDFGNFFAVTFSQTNTGGSLTLGYRLAEFRYLGDLVGSLTYRFEQVQVRATGSSLQSGIRIKGFFSGADGPTRTSSIRLGLRLDARNNRIFPTRGHLLSFTAEHADRVFGSQNLFTRLSSSNRFYFALPLNAVLRFNLTLGWIMSPSPRGVPSFERYRLGGINSIRGYRVFSVGPTRKIPSTADGAYSLEDFNWGGTKQLVFNTEVEFPIIPRVRINGVLFFDAGNSYDDNEFIFQDKRNPGLPLGLYLSVGFGVRWFSPIGPLRFEWGIPLTPRPQDDTILFEFSIGNAF
jgi:outer membrane protein insertion porin family